MDLAQKATEAEHASRAPRCLRVMLVDDHELYRTGLGALFVQAGHKVIEAASGESALRIARTFRPDVVVMDMNMPGTSGIEATRMLVTEHPQLSVLMLTVVADDESVVEALRAGASGYVLKDTPMSEILAGLDAAASGISAISPRVTSRLVRTARSAPGASRPMPDLSDRERAALALIARGYENAQIARQLYISPSTVRNLVSRVFVKLGVDNRVQAATFAVRHDLADPTAGSPATYGLRAA